MEGGKPRRCQLPTALYPRPVRSATAWGPPRIAMISRAVLMSMTPVILHKMCEVKFNNKSDDYTFRVEYTAYMKPLPETQQARRLRLLQELIVGDDHGSQSRMHKKLDLKYSNWSNFLRGRNLSQKAMDKIVKRYPMFERNWLRDGDRSKLTLETMEKIRALEEKYGIDP